MGARNAIAIDLGRRRFRAVLASTVNGGRGGAGLLVKRAIVEDFPADLDAENPQALGLWIGQKLDQARIPRSKATVSIGREHVGLKRITLPTNEPDELADMTRLALQRDLPFDAETAVIDFVPVETGPASTTVLAVAVPQAMIAHARAVMSAAGLSIDRISLRTMGAAALLKDSDFAVSDFGLSSKAAGANGTTPRAQPSNGDLPANLKSRTHDPKAPSALAIDVTGESVEFCLVAGDAIRFSRAAEVPQPQDRLAVADALVTETRRTWMSYRVDDEASDVRLATVMGDQRVSDYACGPLGDMLKIPVTVMREHPRVNANGQDMDRVWPLAGLLLEPAMGREMIDFAHPRKAPDLSARARKRRLLVAGLLVVLFGAIFTLAKRDLAAKQRQSDALASQEVQL